MYGLFSGHGVFSAINLSNLRQQGIGHFSLFVQAMWILPAWSYFENKGFFLKLS
jgi:hypothetical protein